MLFEEATIVLPRVTADSRLLTCASTQTCRRFVPQSSGARAAGNRLIHNIIRTDTNNSVCVSLHLGVPIQVTFELHTGSQCFPVYTHS